MYSFSVHYVRAIREVQRPLTSALPVLVNGLRSMISFWEYVPGLPVVVPQLYSSPQESYDRSKRHSYSTLNQSLTWLLITAMNSLSGPKPLYNSPARRQNYWTLPSSGTWHPSNTTVCLRISETITGTLWARYLWICLQVLHWTMTFSDIKNRWQLLSVSS